MPEVSVLMTVYNGMPYLPGAVDSVLRQTLRDIEVVIVDDGSTDATARYLAGIEDPRVRVFTQANAGTAAAANFGLTHCSAPLLARMDADDISLPHRLERQAEYLRRHPEVGLVGVQMAPLGTGGVGNSLRLPTSHESIFADLMAGRHGMAHSCIMLRTELLKSLGGYWSHPLQDAWDMMLRMGEVSKLANIDEVLHHYRVHVGSLNGSGMRRMRLSIDYARELARRRQQNLPSITPAEFQELYRPKTLLGRIGDAIDLHTRCQYRVAVAEIYGGRPLRGHLRLGWAAALAPQLTFERLSRMVRMRRTVDPALSHEITRTSF
jgi:glycosyltransferase involved in cell wall biosynthesis